MPRPSGDSIPKYRKHKASGQAVVTLNGRDHYLGPHGTKASKLNYDRLIVEWITAGRSTAYGIPERAYTVVELCADYVRYAKAYYGDGPTSELHRITRIVRPLVDLYGRTAASDYGVVQHKTVRQSLMAPERQLSRVYINDVMRRIVAVFKWAAAEGKIPASVPQNLGIIPGLRRGKCDLRETEPVQPVDDATVEATLPHLPAVVADMVRLQRLTGARPAEVCAMRPRDIDRTGDVWLYKLTEHKTAHHGKARTIFIGPQAQAVLLRYLARDHEAFCFSPIDSEAKRRAEQHQARKTPLSCGPGSNRKRKPKRQPGEQYTTMTYRRAIHRACDKAFPCPELAGIRFSMLTAEQRAELATWQSAHRWSPNQLRHAAATEVRRQFGLEAAQVLLGHSRADVTQVYAERDSAKGIEVAKLIG